MKAKKILLVLPMLILAITLQSQTITFILDSIPDYTPAEETIYLTSNLDNFSTPGPKYSFHRNSEDKWEITVAKPDGYPWSAFYYAFTRGGKNTIESDSHDLMINLRLISFPTSRDTTVSFTIENWYDKPGKPSSASWNVIRISEEFSMPQLNRTRGISIYLPPDYNVSNDFYPVVYLQDGQNAFDKYVSYVPGKEWGIDEVLNEMASEGIKIPIVVAIDEGIKRWDEYSPWVFRPGPFWGSILVGGEGDQYIDFIANTLRPYIDSTFRTLSDPDNNCIMGSSMGGLISLYGAMKRPDVFRKAGIFSPAYYVDSVWDFVKDIEKVHPMRLYHLVGSVEGDVMIRNTEKMNIMLGDLGFSNEEIKYKLVEGGVHHEFLGDEFRETYLWLFPEAVSSK